MNLYQTLNQELRDFRVKKLIEAEEAAKVEAEVEEVKPEVVEEVTPETTEPAAEPEALNESEEADIAAAIETEEKVKELDDRLRSIEDALATASEDEIASLEAEKADILNQLDAIEDGLKTESSEEEITEEPVEEVPVEEITDEVPAEEEEVTVESLLDEIATACDSEEGCDCEKVKELVGKAKELLNPETEEVVEEEPVVEEIEEVKEADEVEETEPEELTECEVTSFNVVRKAPSQNVYMIEAQTTEGVKYITGRNYDEESKTLDEAEIADNKGAAANRFKELLANK